MGKYDFEEELSDSDSDDILQDEIQSLSMACMPPSDDPNPIPIPIPIPNAQDFSDDDDDLDDDLEMVRRIKEQYGIGADIAPPLSLKPLVSLPPVSDDDDDDFETLRAIQNRFSQYGGNAPPSPASPSPDSKNGSKCVEEKNEDDHLGADASAENMRISSCTSSFPAAAQTFVEAIKRNRSCQKILRAKMLHIEARMEELKELRKRVKTLRDFQVRCKKKIGRALSQKQDARVQLISASNQKNAVGPLENSHVSAYKSALKSFPISFHREKWSKEESQMLQKEIVKQFQERLFQKSIDVLSALEEPGGANGIDSMISSITNLDITPDMIQEFSGNVDWNKLVSMLPRRTGAECEARWLNHDNCLINQEQWTADEDKLLLLLVQKIGLHNWTYIAEKLGTNRTPFQCLARYQRSLNASILKRDWTEDEDAQLRCAVEAFGGSNWQAVASVMEGRTGTQCSQRWNKTLLPARERVGKWSIDEDKRLTIAGFLFGYKSWNRIANFVVGRTQAQCRERWKNVLDPSLNLGQWTEEEDMKLKAAIAEFGYCWSRIALCVPSRTDSQCRRRWKKLFPDEVPLLEAARKKQKAALIGNFVDRESERPALGVDDFVPLPVTDGTDVLGHEIMSLPQNKSRKRRKTNTTRELVSSSDLKGGESRKRKRCCAAIVDNNNCDEVQNDNGCDTFDNKMRSSRGFKRKKAVGNLDSSTEPKKSQNMPLKSRSRTRKSNVIKVPHYSDSSMSQAPDDHDTVVNTSKLVHSSNQNSDPDVLHGQLTSLSPLVTCEDVETSNIIGRVRKKKPCKKQLRRSSLAENTIPDNDDGLELRTRGGNDVEVQDVAGTTKRKKKRKSQTDHSLEWQDLPLATLFNKAVTRIRGKKSIVRPPIRFTYVRRNKRGTLNNST